MLFGSLQKRNEDTLVGFKFVIGSMSGFVTLICVRDNDPSFNVPSHHVNFVNFWQQVIKNYLGYKPVVTNAKSLFGEMEIVIEYRARSISGKKNRVNENS